MGATVSIRGILRGLFWFYGGHCEYTGDIVFARGCCRFRGLSVYTGDIVCSRGCCRFRELFVYMGDIVFIRMFYLHGSL